MGERTRFCGRRGRRGWAGADAGAGLGRNWIEASAGKGMAAQEPPCGKGAAAQRAMRGDGRGCVLRARRQIPAPARTEGMQRRREPAAIEGDDGEQEARHTSSLQAGCINAISLRRPIPQGLKSSILCALNGTAEAVPFQNAIYATSLRALIPISHTPGFRCSLYCFNHLAKICPTQAMHSESRNCEAFFWKSRLQLAGNSSSQSLKNK